MPLDKGHVTVRWVLGYIELIWIFVMHVDIRVMGRLCLGIHFFRTLVVLYCTPVLSWIVS